MEPNQPQPDIHVDNVERVTQNTGAASQPVNDTLTVRLVVILLGAIVLAVIVAASVLATQDKKLPDVLVGLGGVGVGALAGLLASTASRKQ